MQQSAGLLGVLVRGAQWVWGVLTPAGALVVAVLLVMLINQHQYRLRGEISAQERVTMETDAAVAVGAGEKEWERVQAALKDPKWDFRTVAGIVKETQLSKQQVEELLRRHRSQLRQALARDRRVIYTWKSRPRKLRELLAAMQLFAR